MYPVKKTLLLLSMLFCAFAVKAQNVGIGTATPNANAILDVSSNNKGLLLPRLADTNAITGAKPAGLMMYSNADNQIYFYNGSFWQKSAAQSATDLWYVKNDSVNYTDSKYVGINTNLTQTQPQANLQVNGSIVAQQNTVQSNTAPSAAQTATMNNTAYIQQIGVVPTDSVVRVFDPGGSNNNYTNNMQGNISVFAQSQLGLHVSFNAADFGLGTGDTLWFSTRSDITSARYNYSHRFTNTNAAPSDFLLPTVDTYIYFRSNADGNNNKGFDITCRRIYNAAADYPPVGAVGNAFYFNPSNGALRAGNIGGRKVGFGSIALGNSTTASGLNSTAIGDQTTASGPVAIAMGSGTIASESGSTAMGGRTTASGSNSTAMGNTTTASGLVSTSMGNTTTASGTISTAMGWGTTASGSASTAMGFNTTASGLISAAMGFNTVATAYGSMSMGRFNDSITSSNTAAWVTTDPLLILGNGASDVARSNALVVYKNGNTDINGSLNLRSGNALELGYGTPGKQTDAGKICYGCFGDPAHWLGIVGGGTNALGSDRVIKLWSEGGLRIKGNALPDLDNSYSLGNSSNRWNQVWAVSGIVNTSDARLKTNIVVSPYGLNEVMKMQPVQYNWKTNPNQDLQIGFLAQDIQKIIPEAVVEPANGDPLGMKYNELIPVLVKAIQEQQKKIEELEKMVKALQK